MSVNKLFKEDKVTLDELKQAKAAYVKIAQEDHKKGNYTNSRFERANLAKKFMEWLKDNKESLEDNLKTLWIDGNKYNANIADVNEETGEIDQVISIRVSKKQAISLVDDYNFYLKESE